MGPLTEKQQQLVQTLEVIRIEQMIPRRFRVPGRPPKDRAAMARALVAKAVYDMPTTRVLLDRLDTDVVLRRICGWERRSEVPSESVFSRAFAEFEYRPAGEVGMSASLRKQRLALFDRGNDKCPICLTPFTKRDVELGKATLEHVPPKAFKAFGVDSIAICLTCEACNNSAGRVEQATAAAHQDEQKLQIAIPGLVDEKEESLAHTGYWTVSGKGILLRMGPLLVSASKFGKALGDAMRSGEIKLKFVVPTGSGACRRRSGGASSSPRLQPAAWMSTRLRTFSWPAQHASPLAVSPVFFVLPTAPTPLRLRDACGLSWTVGVDATTLEDRRKARPPGDRALVSGMNFIAT